MSKVLVKESDLSALADKIREKSETGEELTWPNEFVSAVDEIQTHPDLQSKTVTPTTSQQTITPDSGKDGLSSVIVNAISPVKAAQTYTPGRTNQTIAAERWLTGAQTIKGDANLVSSNIKIGVSIFGVLGDYVGDGGAKISEINTVDLDKDCWYFAITTAQETGLFHCDYWSYDVSTDDFGLWKIDSDKEVLVYTTDYRFRGIVCVPMAD